MTNEKYDNEEFKKRLHEIFPKIKPGLQKGKKLYENGLMNLEEKEIKFLLSPSETANALLVFLALLIQAYPENEIEYEDNEGFEWVKTLEFLLETVGCQKKGLLICKTRGNKLNPREKVNIEMTEKGMDLGNMIFT